MKTNKCENCGTEHEAGTDCPMCAVANKRPTITRVPAHTNRVETGPVQFGDDWPGIFIRGDNAAHYALHLMHVIEQEPDPIRKAVLQGLVSDLTSCIVGPMAELILRKSANR